MDKRNDPIKPTRGFFATVGQDFAGVGGSVQFVKSDFQGSWYYGITSGIILQANGSAGLHLRLGRRLGCGSNDRYFKGGNTFRGFRDRRYRSRATPAYQEALGGQGLRIRLVRAELPNLLPEQYGIKTALFTEFRDTCLLDKSAKLSPTVQDNPGFPGVRGHQRVLERAGRADPPRFQQDEASSASEGFLAEYLLNLNRRVPEHADARGRPEAQVVLHRRREFRRLVQQAKCPELGEQRGLDAVLLGQQVGKFSSNEPMA